MLEKKENVPAFQSILETLESMINEEYQSRQWVAREDPHNYSCYDNDTMYFLEDGEAVLDARDANRIEMTERQYKMLKKLYEMVDEYDSSRDRPTTDKEIIDDPEWGKIRDYAKLVYKELTSE